MYFHAVAIVLSAVAHRAVGLLKVTPHVPPHAFVASYHSVGSLYEI